jgi:thiamine biosynthesis lipoprotein
MQKIPRRRILALAAGSLAGGLVGGAWLAQDRSLPSASESPPLATVTRRTWALGTEVSITVRHPSVPTANGAIAAAFAELALVEQLMSIYRPDSELSRLNCTGRLQCPHAYVVQVLREANRWSRESDGAFDVTVQPLWKTFAAAAQGSQLPDESTWQAARQLVDWRKLTIGPEEICLQAPGMAVTLNGIAQGFAADRVLAALRQHGIEHALINAGELATLGCSARRDAWSAGIQHPRQTDQYAAIAEFDGRALATSGDYATRFSADGRHHHLLDPRRGFSPTHVASVSAMAPTAIEADALSTALFVLGVDKGLDLVRRSPGVDALFVLADGEQIITSGFPVRGTGRVSG